MTHKPSKIDQAKIDELEALLKRTAADFANYRRRVEGELANQRTAANEELIKSLLPILDHFDLAIKQLPDKLNTEPWAQGIISIVRQLDDSLNRQGLKKLTAAPGERFDPHHHEAVAFDWSEAVESDHVIESLQLGYQLGGKILRPVMVKVSKGKEGDHLQSTHQSGQSEPI